MEIRSCFMIAICVAFAILHSGEALECYHCVPTPGHFCDKLTEKHEFNCDPNVSHCVSCKTTLSNTTEIFERSCVDLKTNTLANVGRQNLEIEKVECNFCKTKLCNAGNANNGITITLGGFALLWATRFIFTDSY